MIPLNNLGLHVFEKNGVIDWEEEIVAMSLISALSWKNFHGPIKLFCNSEFKKILIFWGVDCVYDDINTELLDNKPQNIDYSKYWAFSKLLVIDHLQKFTPLTVIDSDLWFLNQLTNDSTSDVIMYHKEDFDVSFRNNIYIDFDKMIPTKLHSYSFNKKTLPCNAAILHFNNNHVINEWISLSKEIAEFNFDKIYPHKSMQMCFIEQRLLPMLLEKRNFKYSTFIDNIYISQNIQQQDGSEWSPRLEESNYELISKFEKIKHVWGLKKLFNNNNLRNLVMESLLDTIQDYPYHNLPYSKLINYLMIKYGYSTTI